MNALAIASPILPDKLDKWKQFSKDLANSEDYAALVKQSGLSRIRCWLQEGPAGPLAIILYEGQATDGFLKLVATSAEPSAVSFRKSVKQLHGVDISQPVGPLPELVTDVQVD